MVGGDMVEAGRTGDTAPGAPSMSALILAALGPIVGLLAYTTGLMKAWVIDPVGGWFGDLEPSQKVAVVTFLLLTVISTLAWRRTRRLRSVRAANGRIDLRLDIASPAGDGSGP